MMKYCQRFILLVVTVRTILIAQSPDVNRSQEPEPIFKDQRMGIENVHLPKSPPSSMPRTLSYQGLLTLPSGVSVEAGNYDLQFHLYDSLVGGSSQWMEVHNDAPVQRGTFNVILGSINPLGIDFNRNLYVEVRALDGPAGHSYPFTFAPRSELTSAPYSLAPWATNGGDIYYNKGKVGLGTETPGSNGIPFVRFEIADLDGWNSDMAIRVASLGYPLLNLAKSRGTLISPSSVAHGDFLGGIQYQGYDGTSYRVAGGIYGRVDSTPSTGLVPTALSFQVQNSSGLSEKMRMDRNGALRIDASNMNNGFYTPGLQFGDLGTGESIASKRTVGGNRYGLDFYTSYANRMSITQTGNVGIGTSSPSNRLTILGNTDVTGSLGVGTALPASQLHVHDQTNSSNGARLTLTQGSSGSTITDGLAVICASPIGYLWNYENGPLVIGTNEAERMRISATGQVGIGTNSPIHALQIGDGLASHVGFGPTNGTPNAGFIRFGDNTGWKLHFGRTRESGGGAVNTGTAGVIMTLVDQGNVGIGTLTPSQKLHVVGNICATGTIGACSDLRYKKDMTPLTSSLKNLQSLQGVRYRWKVDEYPDMNFGEESQIGLIAQEVEKLYPEIVQTDADGYKSIDYARLTPVLVEGMKEQQKQIEDQARQILELQKVLNRLLEQQGVGEKLLGDLK